MCSFSQTNIIAEIVDNFLIVFYNRDDAIDCLLEVFRLVGDETNLFIEKILLILRIILAN